MYRILAMLCLLSAPAAAEPFVVDDAAPDYKTRGITVDIPVSAYYPADRHSALYRVLKQAQILTAYASFMGRDGVPYRQHDWQAGSDYANLRRGIDCSRAVWYAFTRAGLPYNQGNAYLPTVSMYRPDSRMREYFDTCAVDDLQTGDVLVYRRGDRAGHTVLVLDPERELAWGSHGWDGSGQNDTGVEVQSVVPDGWGYWDRRNMELKACWRYKAFKKHPLISPPLYPAGSEAGIYPETAQRRITAADLHDKTKSELRLMRNEMFARHGYRFGNGQLAGYFGRQPWYRPVRSDSGLIYAKLFSAIEQDNVRLIYQYEQDMSRGQFRPPSVQAGLPGDYPQASREYMTAKHLQGKSKAELRLMRNEIYARHGYCFGNPALQRHFAGQSWYRCDTKDGTMLYKQKFSQIERYNVNVIQRYEK